MAERPRRTSRNPKRFAEEYCVSASKSIKKRSKDNTLYEIEVKDVDHDKNLVRIHYKGYSDKFDEWRPYGSEDGYFPFIRRENMPLPYKESLDERTEFFAHNLYREIKRKLFSYRRDDPSVRIEVDASEDVFDKVLKPLAVGVKGKGRLVYNLSSNRLLDDVLGPKWDERIINICGDYTYVVEQTVQFWFGKKSSIVEYKIIGKGKYVKSEIENGSQVIFTFVRRDGNSMQYKQRQ